MHIITAEDFVHFIKENEASFCEMLDKAYAMDDTTGDEVCPWFEEWIEKQNCEFLDITFAAGYEKIVVINDVWDNVVKIQIDTISPNEIDKDTVYQHAIMQGLGDFFVPEKLIYRGKGFNIYFQEKVAPSIYHYGMVKKEKLSRSVRGIIQHSKPIAPTEILIQIGWYYGISVVEEMAAFIVRERLIDLHHGNWSVDKFGRLRIFDYSPGGFCSM